uniref:Genome polyprotein n=1 Tax=Hangzhou iflavirus 5 TaxID=2979226 RepID=A0A977P172_9VIRU|nr:polyprotein [Hangzhou iflavirus 5]WAM46882.1 polyprotein [Hangzhou iflavirus 5]
MSTNDQKTTSAIQASGPSQADEGSSLMTGPGISIVSTETSALVMRDLEVGGSPSVTQKLENRGEDKIQEIKFFLDRDYFIEEHIWPTAKTVGNEVFDLVIPSKLTFSKTSIQDIMKQFAYVRPSFRFTFQTIAPRVSTGRLSIGGYYWYGNDLYGTNFMRRNYRSFSHTQRGVLNLATGASVTMDVPFEHFLSYMPNDPGGLDKGSNDMFRISGFVLAPASREVKVQIYCRIISNQFNGFRGPIGGSNDDNVYQGIISRMLGAGVKGVADSLVADLNRDMPPSDQSGSRIFVPQPLHTLSAGTGVALPCNVLRLDPRQMTPSRGTSELFQSFKKLASVPGIAYNATIGLTTDVVMCIPVTPIPGDLTQSASSVGTVLSLYPYPPVSVVAGLHCFWKGGLRYRFEFSNNSFQTCRLLFSFVPDRSVADVKKMELSALTNCYYKIVEIRDTNVVEFDVPYTAPRPWFPCDSTKLGLRKFRQCSIGSLIVKAITPLQVSASAGGTVYVTTYISGSSDFEIAVPRFSALLPVTQPYYALPGAGPRVSPGYYPCQLDTWRYAVDVDGKLLLVLRYGPGSDHVSAFLEVAQDVIYAVNQGDRPRMKFYLRTGEKVEVTYLVVMKKSTTTFYMTVFHDIRLAQQYVLDGKRPVAYEEYKAENADYYDVQQWNIVAVKEGRRRREASDVDSESTSSVEVLSETELDRQGGVAVPSMALGGFTDYTAMDSFGEDFDSIKNFCRRKQFIGRFTEIKKNYRGFHAGQIFHRIPCRYDMHVYGSVDTTHYKEDLMYNYCRSGCLSVIASGFTFGRGGLRYTIVCHGDSKIPFGVAHIPDHYTLHVEDTGYVAAQMFFNSGYAVTIVDPRVNPTVDIEVPYYSPYERILLNHKPATDSPFVNEAGSLGDLVFFCLNDRDERLTGISFSIFASYADDVELTCFRGFPSMTLSGAIPELPYAFQGVVFEISYPRIEEITDESEMLVDRQGWLSGNQISEVVVVGACILAGSCLIYTTYNLRKSVGCVAQNIGRGVEIADRVADNFGRTSGELREIMAIINSGISKLGMSCEGLADCFFDNVCAIVLTPTVAQVLVSTIDVICRAGGVSPEVRLGAKSAVVVISRFLEHQNEVQYQGDMAYGFSLFSGLVSTLLGVHDVGSAPRTIVDKFAYLFSLIKSGFASEKIVERFMEAFGSLIDWVCRRKPKYTFCAELVQNPEAIKEWLAEAAALSDPLVREDLKTDPNKIRCLMAVHAIGQQYLISAIRSKEHIGEFYVAIRAAQAILTKTYEEVMKSSPLMAVKIDPYCLQLFGAPGCGKSKISSSIASSLLESIDYKTYENITVSKTPGVRYFNLLGANPIYIIDDLFALSGQSSIDQAADVMNLKSSAVFNPNMAELENKRRTWNPLGVILLSNSGWYVPEEVLCKDAFLRRRNSLWEVSLKDDLLQYGTIDNVPKELRVGAHKFRKCNVYRAEAGYGEWVGYETFKRELCADFQRYILTEYELFVARLDAISKHYPGEGQSAATIAAEMRKIFDDLCGVKVNTKSTSDFLKNMILKTDPIAAKLIECLHRQGEITISNCNVYERGLALCYLYLVCPDDGVKRELISLSRRLERYDDQFRGCSTDSFDVLLLRSTFLRLSRGIDDLPAEITDAIITEIINQRFVVTRDNLDDLCARVARLESFGWSRMEDVVHELADLPEIGSSRLERFVQFLHDTQEDSISWSQRGGAVGLAPRRIANCTLGKMLAEQLGSIRNFNQDNESDKQNRYDNMLHCMLRQQRMMEGDQDESMLSCGDLISPAYFSARLDSLRRERVLRCGLYCSEHSTFGCRRHACRHYYIDESFRPVSGPGSVIFAVNGEGGELVDLRMCSGACGLEGASLDSHWHDWVFQNIDYFIRNHYNLSYVNPRLLSHCSDKYNWVIPEEANYEVRGVFGYLCWFLDRFDSLTHEWQLAIRRDDQRMLPYISLMVIVTRLTIFYYVYRKISPYLVLIIGKTSWGASRYLEWYSKGRAELITEMRQQRGQEQVDKKAMDESLEAFSKLYHEYIQCGGKLDTYENEIISLISEVNSFENQGGYKYGGEAPLVRAKEQTSNEAEEYVASLKGKNIESVVPQSLRNSILSALIYKNGFQILYTSERCIGKQYGLFIAGRIALISTHFVEEMNQFNATTLTVSRNGPVGSENNVVLRVDEIKSRPSMIPGFTLIEFPAYRFHDAKDIRKHFISSSEFQNLDLSSGALIEPKPNQCMTHFVKTRIRRKTDRPLVLKKTGIYSALELPLYYEYNIGGNGMCGSVLCGSSNGERIIGMHVAGLSNQLGFSVPIFRELLDLPDQQVSNSESSLILEQHVGKINFNGNYEFLGSSLKMGFPNHSVKSRLERSLFSAEFECGSEPAPLSQADPRLPIINGVPASPMKYGCEKAMITPLPFDRGILDEAENLFFDNVASVVSPLTPMEELLPDQVNFAGISHNRYYSGLTLDTSEGYPLSKFRPPGVTDKRWLFRYRMLDDGLELLGLDSRFEEYHKNKMEQRAAGVIPELLFVNCLKDCKIPKEKLSKPGSTRVFSVCDAEFTWAFRKFFGHFPPALHSKGLMVGVAVGINPDVEWTTLATYLWEVGDNILTGDYKAFGDRLEKEVCYRAFRILIRWYEKYYGNRYNSIREIMVLEVLDGLRISLDSVYRLHNGIPSGFPFTVEINSMVNILYVMMAYRTLIPERPLVSFNRNLRIVTYGDDLIISVLDVDCSKFNFSTLSGFLDKHGIGFTWAEKELQTDRLFLSLYESTFLKRKFVDHPVRIGLMMAPLPADVVIDSLGYVNRRTTDKERELYVSARSALNLAYTRGPDFYNNLVGRLKLFFSEYLGRNLDCYSWLEVDSRVFDSGFWLVRLGRTEEKYGLRKIA